MDKTIETFKKFIEAFKDFSFKTFFTETLSEGLGDVFSLGIVILIVFGIVECLFGWQLVRFELTLGAFSVVTAVCAIIMKKGFLDAYFTEAWMLQMIMILLGLVAAVFTWYHHNLAFFLGMMAASGAALFFLLSRAFDNTMVVAILSGVLSLPLAFLLKQLLMPLVVSLTSIGGALIVALSISGFLNRFLPAIGVMLLTDLTVAGLIFQIRRLLKRKVDTFMHSTMQSTNAFLRRYEGDVTSISRNFFSRIGF